MRTVAFVAAIVSLAGFAVLLGGNRPEAAREPGEPVNASMTAPRATVRDSSAAPVAAAVVDRTARSIDATRVGLDAYARGDVAASEQQFVEAVEADPSNPQALNNLGQVLVRTGRARDAIPYFDRAVELSGGTWAYHFNRARAYAELKEWGRAIPGYRDAARLFPDDYVTAFNLARALQASGDLAGAVEEFERAIALAPGEPQFHLSHAGALELAGRPDAAAAAYRRFLELDGSSADAEKIAARAAELEAATP